MCKKVMMLFPLRPLRSPRASGESLKMRLGGSWVDQIIGPESLRGKLAELEFTWGTRQDKMNRLSCARVH